MPRVRLGVALLIPEPVRTEIDALRRAVGDGSLDRVPAHLTMAPPVNVNERHLDDAFTLLRDAAAACPPLTLELGPAATFLPANPVLYLAVGGDTGAVEALRLRVFRPPLHREPPWPFVPHVTLSEQDDAARIADAARVLSAYRATVTIDRVHILKEVDQRWVPFADAALAGRRVVGRGGLELEITESAVLDPDARARLDAEWERLGATEGTAWNQQSLALTARRGGGLVGFASGWTNEGVGHLAELVVIRGSRSEGIGGHLLAAFEDMARKRGSGRLSLDTDANGPARAFYEGRGWRVECDMPDWVDGRHFVRMRKDV